MSSETRLLEALNQRLTAIERKLTQLETSKTILDEKKIVARRGELEGKTYTSNENGGITKEVRVPVCDNCGTTCEKFNACSNCQKKLCRPCCITYQSKIYCAECLGSLMPLSKLEYKVLSAIANEVDPRKVSGIAGLRSKDVDSCQKSLAEKQMIESEGFLFRKEPSICEKGLEAISAYRQVYGNEEDLLIFDCELRRVIDEKC